MNFGIFIICCSIAVLSREAESTVLIYDFLSSVFEPAAGSTNVRHLEIAEALKNNYVVKDTMSLVKEYGYPVENHTVTTEDGYNIMIFRIPGTPKSPSAKGKPVVLIQHGILLSSDSWVLFGSGYDLAFLLADDGYDVWLGNVRGNTYGRSHVNLTVKDKEFWDYSYHEIGTRDMPTTVDYVLNHTGQTDLVYIGHSMSTTTSYVMLSEMPEYNKKMRLVVSLAPVALWNDGLNLFYKVFTIVYLITKGVMDFFGIYSFLPQSIVYSKLVGNLCGQGLITQILCTFVYAVLFGRDNKDFDYPLLPYILLYAPAGISTNTLYHFGKNLEAGLFQKWDYGKTENERIYGTKLPPSYDLTKILAPVALFYGPEDQISKAKNNVELGKQLPNVVTIEPVPYDFFNHLDYMWATNARDEFYDRLIGLMSEFRE